MNFFWHFLTLIEITFMMKEFIMKRLSESLLSSRLFRIKALGTDSTISIMIFLETFLVN